MHSPSTPAARPLGPPGTPLPCCRRVQNLFHSVQLNVNNPHFLIMQGRITKVLNMKPPEILGLLEEAAGTKMYETKKQAAQRTLQKKQIKVDEINKVGLGGCAT
jgi:structural maintenance of chromosome 2